MWKFRDFSFTQILCEIDFGDSKGKKSVILMHLQAVLFEYCEFLHFLKAEI